AAALSAPTPPQSKRLVRGPSFACRKPRGSPPPGRLPPQAQRPANQPPCYTPFMIPDSVDAVAQLLASGRYLADRRLATALFLSLRLQRPLLLEGEAGVGKTEIAKVLAATLDTRLIRLQCYEGLDVTQAAYEWNVARQMLEIRLGEASGAARDGQFAQSLYRRELLIE